MTVRAMFYCESKTPQPGSPGTGDQPVNVSLSAAFGTYLTNKGLPEEDANTDWAKYTPSGHLTMTIYNDAATEQFELGEVYEIVIKKVSKS